MEIEPCVDEETILVKPCPYNLLFGRPTRVLQPAFWPIRRKARGWRSLKLLSMTVPKAGSWSIPDPPLPSLTTSSLVLLFCPEGRVAGAKPGRSFLYRGKSRTVSLSVPYTERNKLLEGKELKRIENRRLCGISEEWQGTLDWLSFAGYRIVNPTVRFRIPGTERGDTNRTADAVVGRELLKHFDITFWLFQSASEVCPERRQP